MSKSTERLQKRLFVTLSTQTLSRQLGYLELDQHKVSAGTRAWPTPVGDFRVRNKSVMAWSPRNKLHLPYWLGFAN